jgi:hypothetical protein
MSMIALLLVASQTPLMPPGVEAASAAWGSCHAERRLELWPGPGTPEAVTDAALAACAAQEEAMFRALAQAYGPARARGMVGELRAQFRALGIASVRQLRGGPPVTDPEFLWGQCVGARVRALAAGAGTPDAIVDGAFAACAAQERVVRSAAERQFGAERASAYVAAVRRQMRARATGAITEGSAP